MSPTVRASWSSPARRHPARWRKLVTAALTQVVRRAGLTDEKGRRFLVQTAKIAYVEIGAADVAPGRLRHRGGAAEAGEGR